MQRSAEKIFAILCASHRVLCVTKTTPAIKLIETSNDPWNFDDSCYQTVNGASQQSTNSSNADWFRAKSPNSPT